MIKNQLNSLTESKFFEERGFVDMKCAYDHKTPPENMNFVDTGGFDFIIKENGRNHDGFLMEKDEWILCVEGGMFIDDDGMGDPCHFDYEAGIWRITSTKWLYPSQAYKFPEKATHILWYNK